MKHRESDELITFFDYVRRLENRDPRFKSIYHIANERKTTPRAGYRLKQKGVRAGVPDVCVPIPTKQYSGLYIEFKIKPNKLTEHQTAMCTLLHGLGYCVRVAWSSTEAIQILKDYLEIP